MFPVGLIIAVNFVITKDKIRDLQYKILESSLSYIISKCESEFNIIDSLGMASVSFYKDATQRSVIDDIANTLAPGTSIAIFEKTSKKLIFFTNANNPEIIEDHLAHAMETPNGTQTGYDITTASGEIRSILSVAGEFSEWDWIIVSFIDKKGLLNYIHDALVISIAVTGIFLLFILLGVYKFSNKFSNAIAALERGAMRLASRDFDTDILIEGDSEFSRLATSFNRMSSEIKTYQNQLVNLAMFDALTGLPNRVQLSQFLQHMMDQERRRERQLAVVYLDLDGFKSINDVYGHMVGDQFLVALSQKMKTALRKGDLLARLGGDEFVAVLTDLNDITSCESTLERLLIASRSKVMMMGCELQVSASLGVTFYPQAQNVDADQLLRQADQAMYQAKLIGRNYSHIFDAEQDSVIRSRNEQLELARLAIQRNEFVLYYQPKVNMRTGQIIGAEALIRWQHPTRGLLLPADFLPAIEGYVLLVAIGEWVVETALSQIESWHASGLDIAVSVNVSAIQMQQHEFVERLQKILWRHPNVAPASLEMEILETSALKDIEHASQVIDQCRQLGIQFALDDFGTGYSSLTYLRQLSVSTIKIDQSFVLGLLDDLEDVAILKGIINLATAINREVLAEGVETVAHGNLLLTLGCELAQGFAIAPPMPSDQLLRWAADWNRHPQWGPASAS